MHPPRAEASDAILTVPNLLTFFRLALIPLFLWLAIGPDRLGAALGVAVLGVATDIVDGKIARRYGQVSKLGVALDPLSDRLGLASAAAVLIVHDLAPLWAVLLVAGRDAALLAAAPVLRYRRIPIPPVTRVGKYGSFAISVSFTLFLTSGIGGVTHPNGAARAAGLAAFVVAGPLYYVSGIGYARTAIASLRRARDAGTAAG